MPVRDQGLSNSMIVKLWSEGKDHARDEMNAGARAELKRLLEGSILDEFEQLIRCDRYERSQERQDYRNGFYTRGLMTTMGRIAELRIPRARNITYRSSFFRWYQRRQEEFDLAVLKCFLGGVSMRDNRAIARAFTGAGVSASTVSRILKGADRELQRFRKRPITGRYRFLFIDALWMTVRRRYDRKSPVLFALAIDENGEKTLLGFKLAFQESQLDWAAFLEDLRKRGLNAETLELIVHDGASGIAAAIAEVFPCTKSQLCAEHKARAAAKHLKNKRSRRAFLAQARNIYRASDVPEARRRLDAFSERWGTEEKKAANSLRRNFGRTLVFMQFEKHLWDTLRTTNPIERYQQEIRRRTDTMRSFSDDKSCERIVNALVLAIEMGMLD
jgi:putative transposase